jgi:hypothetical protein
LWRDLAVQEEIGMAALVPGVLPKDESTAGERKVFSLLKQLPETCLVYYDLMVGERDRRPDFVVIDVEHGITIIEVKDWGIDSIKGKGDKRFRVLTSHGIVRTWKNPERKVRLYLEDVREQMGARDDLCDRRGRLAVSIRYFVAFPNIRQSEFVGASLDQHISVEHTLLREDLASTEAFTGRYWADRTEPVGKLSHKQLNAIRISLFPELIIPGSEQWFSTASASAGPATIPDEDVLEFGLDLSQEAVAKSLGHGPRLLRGLAGTGKTLILLFHAKLLSANNRARQDPKKILILCWNISLAQYMRHAYTAMQIPNADSVEILHFSEFARRLIRRKGDRFPFSKLPDFDNRLTDTLFRLHMSPHDVYSAIYVDEAQDFKKEWIEFIFHNLLSGKPDERNLVIAGDDMQRIYKNRSFATAAGFTWKSLGIPITAPRSKVLKKIYRNSARVWAYTAAFLGDISSYYEDDKSGIKFAPKRGFDPQLISCKNLDEQIEKAVDIVGRLAEQGYSPRNAMILYRRVNVKGYRLIPRLLKMLHQKGIPYQWITEDNEAKATFRWADDSVKISTVHSAKGMDAPVVVVLSAETFTSGDTQSGEQDEEKLMYVALTRAREYLVVLHTGDDGMVPRLKTAMSTYKKYRNEILELEEAANRETFA